MNTARVTKTAKAEVKTADKENVKVTAAKAEPVKTEAPVKAEPAKAAKAEPKTTKAAAKAEPVKTTKAAAKAEPAKTTKAAKTTAKAATKKTTAKKTATTKRAAKATEEVFIQYGGGEVSTSDIVARVVEATGKKASAIKALNVYVQPETGKIYYTADGMSGEIAY